MLFVDTVAGLKQDIILRQAAYACVRLNWSQTDPGTADLYNRRKDQLIWVPQQDVIQLYTTLQLGEGSRCHVLTLQHGLEWADWFLIILQTVSGAMLTHRCLYCIVLAETVVLPSQPHSIWFWQEHTLGQRLDTKTRRHARDASLNWTPFAPYCPCRYLLSLLYLVILEAAHISRIHAGNCSRRGNSCFPAACTVVSKKSVLIVHADQWWALTW